MYYLVDKSAFERASTPEVRDRLKEIANQGRLATCQIVDLEILYSARNLKEFERQRRVRAGYRQMPITSDVCDQALVLQRMLAEKGLHRRPIPDLLIAATAVLNDLVVLHFDKDFEIIARVCELRHEWVMDPEPN